MKASGAPPVIPPKANRPAPRPYNKALYQQRNQIERRFSKLKHFRRLAARFEKNQINFQAVVALACSVLLLA
ncbi:MAG: transposase [Bryobacteraceae bacterium]